MEKQIDNQPEACEEKEATTEQRLAAVESQRRDLRAQVTKERKEKLENASNVRGARDSKIKEVSAVLNKVQSKIFAYNKSGKVARAQNNILEAIAELVVSKDTLNATEKRPSY